MGADKLRVMGKGLGLAACLLGLGVASSARAESPEELVDRVEGFIIVGGDTVEMNRWLDQAEALAPQASYAVDTQALAGIWWFRGVLSWEAGDPDSTLEHWRQALLLDPSYPFDSGLVYELEMEDLYNAMSRDLLQARRVPSQVHDGARGVTVYIDGQAVSGDESVIVGRHLVQVACGPEQMEGWWFEFGQADPDYYGVCGDIVFDDPSKARASKEKASKSKAPKSKAPKAEKAPRPPREPLDVNWTGVALYGGGGALVLAGTTTNFVLVNPTWRELEEARSTPARLDREQADALSAEFNRQRYLTLGLLGTGAALVGTGLVLGEDLSVSATPSSVLLTGRF